MNGKNLINCKTHGRRIARHQSIKAFYVLSDCVTRSVVGPEPVNDLVRQCILEASINLMNKLHSLMLHITPPSENGSHIMPATS